MDKLYNRIEKFCKNSNEQRINRRNFLKSLLILSGALAFLGKTESAYAHPPSDIKLNYDPETKILNAIITHQVSNPQKHFIHKVEVALNDKVIIEHKISWQDNNATQSVSYLIPDTKPQDTFSLEAYCNLSGQLKKEIKIS